MIRTLRKAGMKSDATRGCGVHIHIGAKGHTPQTIRKAVRDLIAISKEVTQEEVRFQKDPESMSASELEELIRKTEKQMRKAAADLNFEAAAALRDQMTELKKHLLELTGGK